VDGGKGAQVTTGARVGAKYLFWSWRQTGEIRGKICRPRDSAWQKTKKCQDKNAGGHDRGVGGAPVASSIVQRDQQEGNLFRLQSLNQRATKKMSASADERLQGFRMWNGTNGGAGGMVGIRGRGDM
jgi:hypothetical protein